MPLPFAYRIGAAQKMSVDIEATPDLLLLIWQKLCFMQYRYESFSFVKVETASQCQCIATLHRPHRRLKYRGPAGVATLTV